MRLSNELLRKAQSLIAARLGFDFAGSRQAELEERLLEACQSAPNPAPDSYVCWLESLSDESPEWGRLAGFLTMTESSFFRDGASYAALTHEVLPSLIAARQSTGILRLRIWSAGCATGEEPYSVAILLDRLIPDQGAWALTILATDVNPVALEAARRGLYTERSLGGTPAWFRDRYFCRQGAGTFELDSRIRKMITFAPLNLAQDCYPSVVTNTNAMDLILCRNVLGSFTPEVQRAAASRLERVLVPGGWLVVGPDGSPADTFRSLACIRFPSAIFYRKNPVQPLRVRDSEQSRVVDPQSVNSTAFPQADRRVIPIPRSDTSDPSTFLDHARALADLGHLEQALHLCKAALAVDPLESEAYLLLAALYREQGNLPAALDALRRAIYLAPDSAPAHFLLGAILLRHGEDKRGRRSMQTVVRLLTSARSDENVPGSGGLTAGQLVQAARAYMELLTGDSPANRSESQTVTQSRSRTKNG